MTRIIFERLTKINISTSRSSEVSFQPTNTTHTARLPKLEFLLLKLLYDDHMLGVKTERSLKELARRFKRNEWTICRALGNLVKRGFSEVKKMGQAFAQRCITLCGFSWLDNQSASQTASLNSPIPYYNPLKREESNLLDNISEKNCGQTEEEIDPETFIDTLPVAEDHRESLKQTIKRSSIGHNRLNGILRRFVSVSKKKPIQSILGYLTKAIENEQRAVWQLKHLFYSKGMRVNRYAD